MLCDFGDSWTCTPDRGRSCGPTPRNYFRFEVGTIRSGEGSNRAYAFCFCGRQLVGVRGVQASASGRDARAVGTGVSGADFHAAPAAHPAGYFVDDLCSLGAAHGGGRDRTLLSEFLCRAALGARIRVAEVARNPVLAAFELLRHRLLLGG